MADKLLICLLAPSPISQTRCKLHKAILNSTYGNVSPIRVGTKCCSCSQMRCNICTTGRDSTLLWGETPRLCTLQSVLTGLFQQLFHLCSCHKLRSQPVWRVLISTSYTRCPIMHFHVKWSNIFKSVYLSLSLQQVLRGLVLTGNVSKMLKVPTELPKDLCLQPPVKVLASC